MPDGSAPDFDLARLDTAAILQIGQTLQKLHGSRDSQLDSITDRYQALTPQRRQELYETDPWIGQLIDWLPDSMCQKWATYKVKKSEIEEETEPESIKSDSVESDLCPYDTELGLIQEDAKDALKLARIHGWSALMLYVDDGQKLDQPVNERSIRSIEGFSVFRGGDAGEISVASWQDKKTLPNYGKPELFTLDGDRVHHSRLLLFYGVKKLNPYGNFGSGTSSSFGLGTSTIDRAYSTWKDFSKGGGMIAQNLHKSSQRILKIKGFKQLAANRNDLEAYIAGMAYSLNCLGIMAIDADDADYDVIEHNYTGVPELLKHFKNLFGGAANMMHTDIFGESPTGQTSGSYQEKWKAGFVHAAQESELKRPLLKYLRYCHLRDGTDPSEGVLEFPSLYELDDEQKAGVVQKQAAGLRALVGASSGAILTPDEAAQYLSQFPDYQSVIDWEQRESDLESVPEGQIPIMPAAIASGLTTGIPALSTNITGGAVG